MGSLVSVSGRRRNKPNNEVAATRMGIPKPDPAPPAMPTSRRLDGKVRSWIDNVIIPALVEEWKADVARTKVSQSDYLSH